MIDCLVIGSGPGGSITACAWAERARSVTVLEEGNEEKTPPVPFSVDEMERRYRNGGQTATFGSGRVIYVEARTVGGGSEVNSGLYHRTPPEMLSEWSHGYGLEQTHLDEHFSRVEHDLEVRVSTAAPAPAGLKLRDGAAALGWSCQETPSWYTCDLVDGQPRWSRRTMSSTYLARARAAGADLKSGWRATRLQRGTEGWKVSVRGPGGERETLQARHVYCCAGAVQTPLLLMRSGIRHNVGRSLALHPTAKVLARFPEAVNARGMGIPPFQVRHFAPRYSFGSSVSGPEYLATSLIDFPEALQSLGSTWPRTASYYCMVEGDSRGRILSAPGFTEPVVLYPISEQDAQRLAEGLKNLCRLLFAAGAEELYPSLAGQKPLRSLADVEALPDVLNRKRAQLMTIHLFSSCPIGQNRARTAADSFGRVWDAPGLFVNDASMLPSAPGVNPQGSIMGFAWRNALQHLEESR